MATTCCLTSSYATAGNLDVVMKLLGLGYWASSHPDLPYFKETTSLVQSFLVWGHFQKAKILLAAFPEFGSVKNIYGISPFEMIEAAEASAHSIPPRLGIVDGKVPKGSGGWPAVALPFPGFPDADRCDIAQISGKAAVAYPRHFVREFVFKKRPVILRDFVRHDQVGTCSSYQQRRVITCEATLVCLVTFVCLFAGIKAINQAYDQAVDSARLGPNQMAERQSSVLSNADRQASPSHDAVKLCRRSGTSSSSESGQPQRSGGTRVRHAQCTPALYF